MPETKRFTVTVDRALYERLLTVTDEGQPRLPKRYVVELALSRLFEAMDKGQLELGLDLHNHGH